ncbi:DUF6146 family protein [Lacinutrix salivirga]
MKNLALIGLLCIVFISCNTTKKTALNTNNDVVQEGDTLKISGDNLEYDIIIIEPGFNAWLISTAQPEGYYSQSYLETKNQFYVNAWNNRVISSNFNRNLYEMQINYDRNIDYGYEVNYKLYNYFIFFQNKYNQNLLGSGRVPPN